MKKKIEYVIVELNQPSEIALERLHKIVYEMITKGYDEIKMKEDMK